MPVGQTQKAESLVKVGLVQINNSFSGQDYFPYSVGMLEAYARAHLKRPHDYEFLLPIYRRIGVREAVERLADADLVAFSAYVWNINISLKIARLTKEQNPRVLIVFGGPQVPDHAEGFLRQHPFIDIVCHGEGEAVFTAVLEHCRDRDWQTVPSVSYLRDGVLIQHARAERLRDLSQIPSPYLNGTFDPLMRVYPDQVWIAMWETNRGCPFSCTFCDWGSAVTAKVNRWELERLYREVDWFAEHRIEFVFCADANFGILPRDVDLARYCAEVRSRSGYPRALSVQSTKNATDRSFLVQKILADAGLNKGVVVSMQSLDPQTLKAIKRDNISIESFKEIQRRFSEAGVETMTDLILGLPGETYDSFVRGVDQLIALGQHNRIQFNNLSILPNAEMGDPEYQRRFGMETVISKVINIHGARVESEDDSSEFQELVIATASLPREDWVRVRAFAWMCGLLHFDKIMQIPLVVLHEVLGLSYRALIELFSESPLITKDQFPILSQVRASFRAKAEAMQLGEEEYSYSKQWLGIWWPPDELVFIELSTESKLAAFYQEAERALSLFLTAQSIDFDPALLAEAIRLNRELIKAPFESQDLELELSFNLMEFYHGVVGKGPRVPLTSGLFRSVIDRTSERWSSWEEWCERVVWFGNKKGAYLYGNAPQKQLAGHF